MFDNFERARQNRKARWVYGVLAGVIAVHGVLLLGLLAKSWWNLDKLSLPHEGVALAVAPPPPSPPPARKGSRKVAKSADATKAVKRVTEDTTQPVRLSAPAETGGDTGGEQLGVPDGLDIGVADSDCVGIGCDPNAIGGEAPPATDPCKSDNPPARCQKDDPIVPQVAVDKQRIAGNDQIHPEGETKLEMVRDRKRSVVFTAKMCINEGGNVRSLEVLKSTGYPEYDRKIVGEMRQWRYTPFEVNGQATPVCTAITIVYKMI